MIMWTLYTLILASAIVGMKCQFNFPSNCNFHQLMYPGMPQTSMTCPAGQPCVTWHSPLTTGPSSGFCSRQGVLKINPGAGTQKADKISIYIALYQQTGWSFNIGDSDTNNGYGGDSSTSNGWAAEIHNVNNELYVYENVAWKIVGPPPPGQSVPDYFVYGPGFPSSTFNVNITKCNRISMQKVNIPGSQINMWEDHMFKFDDVYVGLNRVVVYNARSGVGACAVCVKFESNSQTGTCNPPGYKYCPGCNNP